jgi:hypothetical protein
MNTYQQSWRFYRAIWCYSLGQIGTSMSAGLHELLSSRLMPSYPGDYSFDAVSIFMAL